MNVRPFFILLVVISQGRDYWTTILSPGDDEKTYFRINLIGLSYMRKVCGDSSH